MVEVRISYGFDHVEVEIPDERYAGSYEVTHPPKVNVAEILEEALNNPIGDRLEEIKASSALLVINDHTRLTPTETMLDHILPRLKGKEISTIVATGHHRAPTEEELRRILGRYYGRLKIIIHDARTSPSKYLGETSRGTPIEINEELFKYDLVVTLGSVEPHYFAGFTGGRKSIAPGVCGFRCIERNHMLVLDPNSALAKLKGNPVHEDLEEIVREFSKYVRIFSLNVSITGEGRPFAAAAGDIFESFYRLVGEVRKYYEIDPPHVEVVVAVAPGNMGVDLYQAQKALEPAKFLVKDGGVIVLVAPCRGGIGPRTFYDLLSGRSREEVWDIVKREFKLGYHKAVKILETLEKAKVFAVTDLDPEVIRNVGFEPFSDLQKAIEEAIRETDGRVIVLPEASISIPRLSS